ncbi:MAG TPA: hypothetical protein VIF62_21435 [Labilithrix sp.]|jgi:hypothetical protein
MTPDATEVTVVWIAPVEGRDDAQRALVEWGRARGISLTEAPSVSAAGLHVEAGIAERVERELDRAKEAIASLDADAAERALARAETMLRDHPELVPAAWLRAEVDRAWAARWTRVEPRDEARARVASQDADALDGGRVPGIGEAPAPPRAKVKLAIDVKGASGRSVVVYLDGAPLAAKGATYVADVAPAEHQVIATVDGDPVFASWVAVGPSGANVQLPLAAGGACDATSFANVAREPEVPPEAGRRADGAMTRIDARGVSCDRWVAAMPGEKRGSVLVARCERDTCGPLLEWRTESLSAMAPPQPGASHSGWPAWATWTLVGVGAATATTIAIVATGALESRPTEQRFVSGGVRVESHR